MYSRSYKAPKEKSFVVYIARSIDGTVLYVGHGAEGREKHCASGTSHVYELNKMHFSGQKITTEVVFRSLCKNKANDVEYEKIKEFNPVFNKMTIGRDGFICYSSTYKSIRDFLSGGNYSSGACRKASDIIEGLVSTFKFTSLVVGVPHTDVTEKICKFYFTKGLTRRGGSNFIPMEYKDVLEDVFEISNKTIKLRDRFIVYTKRRND
jgi:excinuclease UvrABC nuclease subunit